ncbi:MAG TPA: hypothetical protein VNN19_09310, partial [bacterium]|nr:hypothetical protein [bacterium]
APARSPVTLTDVSHALDGRMLIITGRVGNEGDEPLVPLVIDVAGYGPSGDLVVTGSDGIPWPLAPGGVERFTIPVPLARALVREYVVQVSRPRAGPPLASARRGVDVALYRDFLPTLIALRGRVEFGLLTIRAEGPGLPVARVTAEATVLVFDPVAEWFKPVRLTLDIPPDGATTVFVGSPLARLVALRLVDVRLKSSWSD